MVNGQAGKGDRYRQVNKKIFDRNYDNIDFENKTPQQEIKEQLQEMLKTMTLDQRIRRLEIIKETSKHLSESSNTMNK